MAIYLGSNNGYRTQRHTIPAESVYTVDFEGCNPNYYRLMNTGNVTLFCATKSLPTTDNYNFKANPISVANFCEPVVRDKLYILNNTKEEVKVILTTWEGEFNPTFMAVSEISLNNEGTIKTDGMINGFTVPLPSGDNKIGKVEIEGGVDIDLTNLENITQALKDNNVTRELFTQALKDIYNSMSIIGDKREVYKTGIQIYMADVPESGLVSDYSQYNGSSGYGYCYIGEFEPGDIAPFVNIRYYDETTSEYVTVKASQWAKICHSLRKPEIYVSLGSDFSGTSLSEEQINNKYNNDGYFELYDMYNGAIMSMDNLSGVMSQYFANQGDDSTIYGLINSIKSIVNTIKNNQGSGSSGSSNDYTELLQSIISKLIGTADNIPMGDMIENMGYQISSLETMLQGCGYYTYNGSNIPLGIMVEQIWYALTNGKGTLYEDTENIDYVSPLKTMIEDSLKMEPKRIIDGTANGYVMDETWVQANDGEYVGEILNYTDKIEITTIRASQFGENDIQGFTIAEWNNVCHKVKAHTVSFVMKENDSNNRIYPYFAVYNI